VNEQNQIDLILLFYRYLVVSKTSVNRTVSVSRVPFFHFINPMIRMK